MLSSRSSVSRRRRLRGDGGVSSAAGPASASSLTSPVTGLVGKFASAASPVLCWAELASSDRASGRSGPSGSGASADRPAGPSVPRVRLKGRARFRATWSDEASLSGRCARAGLAAGSATSSDAAPGVQLAGRLRTGCESWGRAAAAVLAPPSCVVAAGGDVAAAVAAVWSGWAGVVLGPEVGAAADASGAPAAGLSMWGAAASTAALDAALRRSNSQVPRPARVSAQGCQARHALPSVPSRRCFKRSRLWLIAVVSASKTAASTLREPQLRL